MSEIYTIGYSTHSVESFIKILKKHLINVVADVRSQPFSKFKPEFNKDYLQQTLKNHNIMYVFLGNHCGARIDAPECYVNGKADYLLISKHPKFQKGLERIRNGMKKYHIALMCAEKDPIACHRSILVCRNLSSSAKIKHIVEDGRLEDNDVLEQRLMKLFKIDLFELPSVGRTEKERIEEAYDLQGKKIAYRINDDEEQKQQNRGYKYAN